MKNLLKALLGFVLLWGVLSIWVELPGSQIELRIRPELDKRALIVYDPDPIYNLDWQVCKSFAEGLDREEWGVDIFSVSKASKEKQTDYELYVFCANTYNWQPDWILRSFIENMEGLEGERVVALTIGSGSTTRAKRIMEKILLKKEVELLASEEYWLMRPNDEQRLEEPNTWVAADRARELATQLPLY
ncbi:MAG: hypothetical protein AAFR87_33500 [Bacteroidota bacterium]